MPQLASCRDQHVQPAHKLQIPGLQRPAGISLVVMLFVSVALTGANAHADSDRPAPFAPGERLRFSLKWTIIPAGEATMEVLPMQTIMGLTVYHFRLTARSNAVVDLVYKVRDQIDAFVDADVTHAVRYLHHQNEGDNHKDVMVRFDWENAEAHYDDGESRRISKVKEGAFDPFSVFYHTRRLDIKVGDVITSPVSDGKKCVIGQARVVRKEIIRVASGTYETFLIEPDLKHVGGVFEKKKNAKIRLWITTDEKHLPVKIASKVPIGSFVGELVEVAESN
jgi:hypothetical protein